MNAVPEELRDDVRNVLAIGDACSFATCGASCCWG